MVLGPGHCDERRVGAAVVDPRDDDAVGCRMTDVG
jgi:hypothetical protein